VSNPSIGNGTMHARYRLVGSDLMHIECAVLFGSTTSAGSGNWFFGLPGGFALTGYNASMTRYVVGNFWAFDSGNNIGSGQMSVSPGTTDRIDGYYPSGTAMSALSNTSEGWSTGDQFTFQATLAVA
jgi:hypothetical protein